MPFPLGSTKCGCIRKIIHRRHNRIVLINFPILRPDFFFVGLVLFRPSFSSFPHHLPLSRSPCCCLPFFIPHNYLHLVCPGCNDESGNLAASIGAKDKLEFVVGYVVCQFVDLVGEFRSGLFSGLSADHFIVLEVHVLANFICAPCTWERKSFSFCFGYHHSHTSSLVVGIITLWR
jgi:hypothetical protein